MMEEATPESPVYFKAKDDETRTGTDLFRIWCDEGWRSSTVCTGMYGWAADWLLEQIQGKPFAPGQQP
jgi:hypothetical protein